MTATIRPPRGRARLAATAGDVEAALALRALCFRGGAWDGDRHDAPSRHVLVEDEAGRLVGCARARAFAPGRGLHDGYAAQSYDLQRLAAFPLPLLEVGRLCVHPDARGAQVLRLAWGAVAALAEDAGAGLLFGCASFPGTDAGPHRAAFAHLAARHAAPARWAPGRRAPEAVPLAGPVPDPPEGLRGLPPLLRAYLGMGGWVGDHAVVDRDLGTLHVFVALEVARVPPARVRALRALAGRQP